MLNSNRSPRLRAEEHLPRFFNAARSNAPAANRATENAVQQLLHVGKARCCKPGVSAKSWISSKSRSTDRFQSLEEFALGHELFLLGKCKHCCSFTLGQVFFNHSRLLLEVVLSHNVHS